MAKAIAAIWLLGVFAFWMYKVALVNGIGDVLTVVGIVALIMATIIAVFVLMGAMD